MLSQAIPGSLILAAVGGRGQADGGESATDVVCGEDDAAVAAGMAVEPDAASPGEACEGVGVGAVGDDDFGQGESPFESGDDVNFRILGALGLRALPSRCLQSGATRQRRAVREAHEAQGKASCNSPSAVLAVGYRRRM